MRLRTSLLYLILPSCLLLSTSCSLDSKPESLLPSTITVAGDRFVDDQGRQVILNGINVVSKSKAEQYLFQGGPEFYANLKKWGVNCIRFIIIWDGLEPEPGVYNEDYLKEIDKRIKWAGDNGLFVVLDMHQDLFSVLYSDGAPEWATLHEDKPHQTGEIWSDAYMLSGAVQTSFDNFWANTEAKDGIGIQDHFANLWKHIARRYADNNTVIGYDIMNEPFPGTSANQIMPALLTAYGKLVYSLTGEVMSEEELLGTWATEEARTEALKILSVRENFQRVFDVQEEFSKEFETTQLQPMYQKVGNAIREVDTKHILFLEHSYASNAGVRSSIERTILADGSPDPLVAYAPHGYDLVVDTKNAAASESERVAFIFDRIAEKGAQLNMPVWLGEWGAYYNHDGIVPVARHAVGLIESKLFGQAYWSYNPGTENLEYFQEALLRPYPAYTNGELISYEYDYDASTLLVKWKESEESRSPTVIFIPWTSRINKTELIESTGASIKPIENSDAGWIIIPPNDDNRNREVTVQF